MFSTTRAMMERHLAMQEQSKNMLFYVPKNNITALHIATSSNALQPDLILNPASTY